MSKNAIKRHSHLISKPNKAPPMVPKAARTYMFEMRYMVDETGLLVQIGLGENPPYMPYVPQLENTRRNHRWSEPPQMEAITMEIPVGRAMWSSTASRPFLEPENCPGWGKRNMKTG